MSTGSGSHVTTDLRPLPSLSSSPSATAIAVRPAPLQLLPEAVLTEIYRFCVLPPRVSRTPPLSRETQWYQLVAPWLRSITPLPETRAEPVLLAPAGLLRSPQSTKPGSDTAVAETDGDSKRLAESPPSPPSPPLSPPSIFGQLLPDMRVLKRLVAREQLGDDAVVAARLSAAKAALTAAYADVAALVERIQELRVSRGLEQAIAAAPVERAQHHLLMYVYNRRPAPSELIAATKKSRRKTGRDGRDDDDDDDEKEKEEDGEHSDGSKKNRNGRRRHHSDDAEDDGDEDDGRGDSDDKGGTNSETLDLAAVVARSRSRSLPTDIDQEARESGGGDEGDGGGKYDGAEAVLVSAMGPGAAGLARLIASAVATVAKHMAPGNRDNDDDGEDANESGGSGGGGGGKSGSGGGKSGSGGGGKSGGHRGSEPSTANLAGQLSRHRPATKRERQALVEALESGGLRNPAALEILVRTKTPQRMILAAARSRDPVTLGAVFELLRARLPHGLAQKHISIRLLARVLACGVDVYSTTLRLFETLEDRLGTFVSYKTAFTTWERRDDGLLWRRRSERAKKAEATVAAVDAADSENGMKRTRSNSARRAAETYATSLEAKKLGLVVSRHRAAKPSSSSSSVSPTAMLQQVQWRPDVSRAEWRFDPVLGPYRVARLLVAMLERRERDLGKSVAASVSTPTLSASISSSSFSLSSSSPISPPLPPPVVSRGVADQCKNTDSHDKPTKVAAAMPHEADSRTAATIAVQLDCCGPETAVRAAASIDARRRTDDEILRYLLLVHTDTFAIERTLAVWRLAPDIVREAFATPDLARALVTSTGNELHERQSVTSGAGGDDDGEFFRLYAAAATAAATAAAMATATAAASESASAGQSARSTSPRTRAAAALRFSLRSRPRSKNPDEYRRQLVAAILGKGDAADDSNKKDATQSPTPRKAGDTGDSKRAPATSDGGTGGGDGADSDIARETKVAIPVTVAAASPPPPPPLLPRYAHSEALTYLRCELYLEKIVPPSRLTRERIRGLVAAIDPDLCAFPAFQMTLQMARPSRRVQSGYPIMGIGVLETLLEWAAERGRLETVTAAIGPQRRRSTKTDVYNRSPEFHIRMGCHADRLVYVTLVDRYPAFFARLASNALVLEVDKHMLCKYDSPCRRCESEASGTDSDLSTSGDENSDANSDEEEDEEDGNEGGGRGGGGDDGRDDENDDDGQSARRRRTNRGRARGSDREEHSEEDGDEGDGGRETASGEPSGAEDE